MKNNVFSRRSVRTYKEERVPREVIHELLKAGMQAPSAHNQQPWRFFVVEDPGVIKKLSQAGSHAVMLQSAPLAIVLFADPARFVVKDYWPQDLSAAATTMLLEAVDLGYGGCWIGVYPDAHKMSHALESLGVEGDLIPFAILSLGKPRNQVLPKERYDGERVQWIKEG